MAGESCLQKSWIPRDQWEYFSSCSHDLGAEQSSTFTCPSTQRSSPFLSGKKNPTKPYRDWKRKESGCKSPVIGPVRCHPTLDVSHKEPGHVRMHRSIHPIHPDPPTGNTDGPVWVSVSYQESEMDFITARCWNNCPGQWGNSHPCRDFRALWMWHLGTWISGGLGCAGHGWTRCSRSQFPT